MKTMAAAKERLELSGSKGRLSAPPVKLKAVVFGGYGERYAEHLTSPMATRSGQLKPV